MPNIIYWGDAPYEVPSNDPPDDWYEWVDDIEPEQEPHCFCEF